VEVSAYFLFAPGFYQWAGMVFRHNTTNTCGFVQNGPIYFKYRSGPSISCCIV